MKAVDLCCFSSAVVILATKMQISPMKQSNLISTVLVGYIFPQCVMISNRLYPNVFLFLWLNPN